MITQLENGCKIICLTIDLTYMLQIKFQMTSYWRPPSNNLMKLDCQNRKHKSRVCLGPSELLHKIIGKNDVEKKDVNKKKMQKRKNPYKVGPLESKFFWWYTSIYWALESLSHIDKISRRTAQFMCTIWRSLMYKNRPYNWIFH